MNGTFVVFVESDNVQEVADWVNSEFALNRVATVNDKSLRSRDGNLVAQAKKDFVSFTILGRSSGGVTDLYVKAGGTILVRLSP